MRNFLVVIYFITTVGLAKKLLQLEVLDNILFLRGVSLIATSFNTAAFIPTIVGSHDSCVFVFIFLGEEITS